MSANKSKSTQSSTTNQNQTATSTPTSPQWYQDLIGNYGGQVGAFMGSGQSPYSGASPLQQQAFQSAENLGAPQVNGQGTFDLAAALGLQAGMAPANTTPGAATYTASGPAGGQGYSASGPVGGQGYTAAGPVAPQGYDAAQASANGFNAADLQARMNPYLDQVQGAFTTDFDANAGRLRAGQSATAALNGGARNSNNAVLGALTEGELARARGSGIAGIQNQAYQTAAQILGQDNDRAAQTSIANAGFRNSALGQQYQGNLTAGLDFAGRQDAAGQFGAAAQNQSALDFAGRQDSAGQFGAAAQNQSALDFAGRQDAAGQFGAAATNQNNQFNAAQQDNALARMLQSAGLLTSLGQAQGADSRANLGLQAELGGQQRDIANQTGEAQRLAYLQALLAGIPTDALIGRTGTTTGTTNSSGKSSSSQYGFSLADFWTPGGGFK